MKSRFSILSVVFFLSIFVKYSSGLKCYTCSLSEDDSDSSCVDNPKGMDNGVTDCDKKYCTITRVDYKDPKGKLNSFVRNCVDKPTYTNKVIEDPKFRTYYRSCKTDLCNIGNGHADTASSKTGSLGDKSTIYCPGTSPDGASTATVSLTVVVLCAILSYGLL